MNPSPQFVKRHIQKAELNGCAESPGLFPQEVALAAAPSAPLDDDRYSKPEQVLRQRPLKGLDALPHGSVPEVDPKGRHPVIRPEAHTCTFVCELQSTRGLSATRESADNDEAAWPCAAPRRTVACMSHRNAYFAGASRQSFVGMSTRWASLGGVPVQRLGERTSRRDHLPYRPVELSNMESHASPEEAATARRATSAPPRQAVRADLRRQG